MAYRRCRVRCSAARAIAVISGLGFAAVISAAGGDSLMLAGKPDSLRPQERTSARRDASSPASRRAACPTLEGKWHIIGPFDNTGNKGFDTAYPPEKEIDLTKTYPARAARRRPGRSSPTSASARSTT